MATHNKTEKERLFAARKEGVGGGGGAKHRVHIGERSRGSVTALSAGAYTTTLYVMVDIVKGGRREPLNTPHLTSLD
jgi:hypothetical protein